ncbi:FimV/HubP family polar landmark protein [Thioalkalivibrio sp. ALE23]|uniref:FimV/HubP family polar landmark protein n=1 Tax=Thioalkalivibrio sp. ALE23 TaxID=1265495 RepID=UPI0004775081|nr:FimV/HubP family polar landmark protein [Thioalkalivibrio sp. ALE23]
MLVAPASSSSVGLGDPQIRSTLNQALDVRVALRGGAATDESLQVRQASEERYRRAGLDRGRVPGDLRVELRGEGQDREVVLRTREPVREPYIGVLLEARWDGGRSYREINLLLDPPGTLPDDRAAARTTAAAPDDDRRAPQDTYRVRSGDTLYAIVQRAGLSGVSNEQAMLAFLRENPDAFIDGNVNALRADAELRTPDRAALEAVDAAGAREEIQRQTEAWQARTRPEPEPEPEVAEDEVTEETDPDVAEEAVEEEARDEPEEDPEEVREEEAEREDDEAVAAEDDADAVDDRLEIVTDVLPEGEEAALIAESPEVVQEALISQRAEMDEMQEEIARMRESLQDREQVAEIASEELATLEAQLAELQDERAELRARMEEAEAERDAPLHQRIMNDPLLMMMAIALVVLLVLVLLAFARGGRGGGPGGPGGDRNARVDNSGVKATPDPRSGYEAREEASEPSVSGAAVAGATGGAAGGAVAASTGDSAAEPQDEVPATPARPGGGDDTGISQAEESVGEPTPVGESGASETGGMSADDVLAEVDVCLAYGMNDQAVDTLSSAIDDEPDNLQYRLKLVEAFAAQERDSEMRQAAASLRERLGPEDGEIREKLADLEAGSGDGSAASGTPSADTAASDSADEPGEFDLSGFAEEQEGSGAGEPAAPEKAAGELDSGMDFEADTGLDEELAAASQGSEAGDAAGDLDDLDNLSFDIEESDLPSADDSQPAGGDAGSDVPSMDLDELLGDEAGGDEPPVASAEADEPAALDSAAPAAEGEDDNETRLNLAQAYADMGDQEGAQDLIDEIMASGSDEEKERARAIQDQLKDA